MKSKTNIIFSFCILALAVICYLSVSQPIRFEAEQKVREKAVTERIAKIIIAEQKYAAAKGAAASTLKQLTSEGFLADSLQTIPYSDGKSFALEVDVKIGRSGRKKQTVRVGATYDDYLNGLDKASVKNLNDKAAAAGRYPGVQVESELSD